MFTISGVLWRTNAYVRHPKGGEEEKFKPYQFFSVLKLLY
jgi:hypothetical protein